MQSCDMIMMIVTHRGLCNYASQSNGICDCTGLKCQLVICRRAIYMLTKGNFVYYEGKIKVICGLPANEITCYQTSHDHD